MKFKYTLLFVTITLVLGMLYVNPWKRHNVIMNDTTSYYSYLPAFFIHHDLQTLEYTKKDPSRGIWVEENKDGIRFFKMTMGLALLWLPAFLITWASTAPTDVLYGYDWPFHLSISISAVCYVLLGLLFLHRFAKTYVQNNISTLACLLLLFGSNLLYYTLVAPGMAHAYNFFLIAALLFLSRNGLNTPIYKLLLLGFVSGLIVLIRPTNLVLIALVVALQWVLIGKKFWSSKWQPYLFVLLGGLVALAPQLIYWKVISGSWLFYSYQEEGFFFGFERVIRGIIGFRKGWITYSPVFILLLVVPFLKNQKYRKANFLVLCGALLFSFLIYSWWCWWYGGGFGSRSMIDFYPLLVLPMAAVLGALKPKLRIGLSFVFVGFSLYFSYYANTGKLHYDAMTASAYGKFISFQPNSITGEDYFDPDYTGAKYFNKELQYNNRPAKYSDKQSEYQFIFGGAKDASDVEVQELFYYNHPEYLGNDTAKVVISLIDKETRENILWQDQQIRYRSDLDIGWQKLRVVAQNPYPDSTIVVERFLLKKPGKRIPLFF